MTGLAAGGATIGDREFRRVQALVHREAGISLSDAKKALVSGRLARRLRELALAWPSYLELVQSDPAELVRMLDCITTNETHFFREPRHFDLLEREVFPAWTAEAAAGARPRRVRAWSAACSTGEEPYSLAMSLLRAFPPGSGWATEILATDLSTRVLARAAAGVYPLEKADEIPERDRKAFMLRGHGGEEGRMKAGPELQSLVRFARMNLAAPAYPDVGAFDLVFCRNVLIYFDRETKEQVVRRLLGHVAPGGLLFLGHAESLAGMDVQADTVIPTVYRPRPRA